ncbi:hypothetical protein [Tenacibaculum sp. SZ-18]|uniref:hypothetical protein n=1 Tax=Tenacibaculum sp. SZ-18 TaxID=754423 RepID=UPI0012FDA1E9|nr:hypothetical protein [Tenacibaculum sp. SZ-18]
MQTQRFFLRLVCVFSFTLFSFQNSFSQVEKIQTAISDTSVKFQGKLQQEAGKFRYDYHDVYQENSLAKDLQASGYHGGGPSWLGIIYGAFKLCDNNLIDNVEMKVEVTGVTFWSASKEDLEKIGRVVASIKGDDAILQLAIDKATELGIMQ